MNAFLFKPLRPIILCLFLMMQGTLTVQGADPQNIEILQDAPSADQIIAPPEALRHKAVTIDASGLGLLQTPVSPAETISLSLFDGLSLTAKLAGIKRGNSGNLLYAPSRTFGSVALLIRKKVVRDHKDKPPHALLMAILNSAV